MIKRSKILRSIAKCGMRRTNNPRYINLYPCAEVRRKRMSLDRFIVCLVIAGALSIAIVAFFRIALAGWQATLASLGIELVSLTAVLAFDWLIQRICLRRWKR